MIQEMGREGEKERERGGMRGDCRQDRDVTSAPLSSAEQKVLD